MNKEAKVLISIAIGTIVLLFGGSMLFNKPQTTETTNTKVVDSALLLGSDPHIKGNKDAKVTIVEFGDFQCPACGASEPTIEKVLADYGDRVQFVFRQFPLEQHKNAFYAASASEAASEQGKFWEMHDMLYKNQDAWGEKSNAPEIIDGYAKELGLDMDKYKAAITDKKYDEIINKGVTDGVAAGVNATPTFFINGVKNSILSYNDWKAKLDDLLASQENK